MRDRRQHKIRLAGIDAPERRQAFGTRSRQHLSGLVYRQTVNVEWHKVDRYGRIVGKVWTVAPCFVAPCSLALDANLAQVTAGMAWHYKQYEHEQSPEDRGLYDAAENNARAQRAGLWIDPAPIPPWEFRKQR
jgi:endonuclease YncB( thermonuclease family)